MIRREMKLVITFHTTTEAMTMEYACKTENAPGRLIPVPREISAGCGMAWSAEPGAEEILQDLMVQNGIVPQALQVCLV